MTREPPVIVRQGPQWLVDFLMSPPWWVSLSVKLLGLVVAGVVAYRLHQRRGEITPGQQHAMLQIAGTVVGVMTGVLAVTNYTTQPYLVDVAVGLVAGYAVVFVIANRRLPLPIEDAHDRLAVGWGALAVGAVVLPWVASLNGRGTVLENSRFYLVALGVAMVWYNQFFVKASASE